MSQGERSRSGADLATLASEFFVFVLGVQGEGEPKSFADLRGRAIESLRKFAERSRAAGLPTDMTDHCRYVMSALLDEAVMTSRWAVREEWAMRPLVYELFDDLNAGENVYERLERIRRDARNDPTAAQALEVYATALSLGFRGGRAGPGDEERLRSLVLSLSDEVSGGRGDGERLAPHWRQPVGAVAQIRRLPRWWFAAGAFALVALLAIVLQWLQAGDWDRALEALGGN